MPENNEFLENASPEIQEDLERVWIEWSGVEIVLQGLWVNLKLDENLKVFIEKHEYFDKAIKISALGTFPDVSQPINNKRKRVFTDGPLAP